MDNTNIASKHQLDGANQQPLSAKDEILAIAQKHNITYKRTALDDWADTVNWLSDDDVHFDEIELLLIAIGRAKVIEGIERTLLHHRYLKERDDK